MGIWVEEDKLFTQTGCEDFVVPPFSEFSAFCTRRMTKGLLAKFKKQYGKDGMFASLSLRLHKGFEGFGSTAGRVKNEDEPQVRSERQIKEKQYINSKPNWLGDFFVEGRAVNLSLRTFSILLYQLLETKDMMNYYSFFSIEINSLPLLLLNISSVHSNDQLFRDWKAHGYKLLGCWCTCASKV